MLRSEAKSLLAVQGRILDVDRHVTLLLDTCAECNLIADRDIRGLESLLVDSTTRVVGAASTKGLEIKGDIP